MFACIYGCGVAESKPLLIADGENRSALVELAFTFSPLVEQTTVDTVALDIAGQDLLFGSVSAEKSLLEIESARNVAHEISSRAKQLNLKVNVAVAANPDAAIHAARFFKGVTVIPEGDELHVLASLPIKKLDHSLVGIDGKLAAEIQETFTLWGIRTFGDLARLPLASVAERLGQAGVRLQQLAQGKTDHRLHLVKPPIGFEQSLELEHPISELEPLSFILSRLLNQLCANLYEYALATNELRLKLVTEPQAVTSGSNTNPADRNESHERTITLPVPIRNPKTLLRLLLFEVERQPPPAAIVAITVNAEPAKPRPTQTGLFIPLAPETEKLEITLARLTKLCGAENVGSPESLNTHRPDAFRMKQFRLEVRGQRSEVRKKANQQSAIRNRQCVMGFRIFRPPWRAEVQTRQGEPTRIDARAGSSHKLNGKIICAAGPWRASGDWWRADLWARDEWDVAIIDPAAHESEILCRIYRDLTSEQWFVAGIYD